MSKSIALRKEHQSVSPRMWISLAVCVWGVCVSVHVCVCECEYVGAVWSMCFWGNLFRGQRRFQALPKITTLWQIFFLCAQNLSISIRIKYKTCSSNYYNSAVWTETQIVVEIWEAFSRVFRNCGLIHFPREAWPWIRPRSERLKMVLKQTHK